MAIPSLIEYLKEQTRQAVTQDTNFYKKMVYFFELQAPLFEGSSFTSSFIFPLMLNPQSITFDEPFSVETTMTSEGGLWVEENGIVLRRMHIRGTTGFKPRKVAGTVFTSLAITTAEKRTFDRKLPEAILASISGQRHFQYLQDSVFRTYADLKQDAEKAQYTKLFFHNTKDEEHWEVVPEKFTMNRATPKSTTYEYSIDLLVVAKSSNFNLDYSEDKGLLDSIKDVLRQVNNGIQMVQAGIRDLTNLVADIKGVVANIGTILTNATDIVNVASDFINGVTDLIEMPRKLVSNLITECENAVENIESATDRLIASGAITVSTVTGATAMIIPIEVHQAIKDISIGCSILLLHPNSFETPLQKRLREVKDKQSLSTSVASADLTVASTAEGPSSFSEVSSVGTGLMPGDYNRSKVDLSSGGMSVPQYTSLKAIDVEQSDTLVSLAARYLGDGRKWQDLAILNNLTPPYIFDRKILSDDKGFSGTIFLGDQVLVPNFARAMEDRPLIPVIGVPSDARTDQKLLGSDFALAKVANNEQIYDFVVDIDNGSNDFKVNYGIEALQQAIMMRLLIEKGTDIMYKSVGIEPIVGLKWTVIDEELVKLRIIRSILADTRISGIQSAFLTTSETEIDTLGVEIKAAVFGFSQAAVVSLKF